MQKTARRVAGVSGACAPIIVAAAAHRVLAADQMAAIGLAHVLITEPAGRGSGPAIAAAALEIAAIDPEGFVLAVASDHHIPDAKAFAAGVHAALAAASHGALVTFGVKPTSASAAYGYIQPGEALDGEVRAAARFVEKPAAADASALIEAGWLWNSGNFLFRADVMLDELSAHAPGILDAVAGARDSGQRDGEVLALGESFLDAPSLAIDVAVMETTARGAVLGVDYAWSDLGAWDAVWAAAPHDVDGNAVQGSAAVMVECRDSLVRGPPGARIVAVGLKNIAVVVEGDRILVCELTKAQSISPAVATVEDL